jgi:hypothetical protein
MPLYYQLATVTLVGNAHGIKNIINIPLKTANQHFSLYKIIVLPVECLEIILLNTQLNFCTLALITVTATTFYLRKHTEISALPTALLCALQMCQFTVSKFKPVSQARISKSPPATYCADRICFSTIKHLPSSDMGHCGCITSQSHARLLHAAPAQTDGQLTQKHYLTQE